MAFKPGTDDIREAPALKLIQHLLEKDVKINACDPKAIENTKKIFNDVKYFENEYDSLKGSEGLILATEWKIFRTCDFDRIKSLLKTPVIFDGRNTYSKSFLNEKGFDYFGIGV